MNNFNEILIVGIIQTNFCSLEAWRGGKKLRSDGLINMEYIYEELVWNQIVEGFSYFKYLETPPHLIIMPELTLPVHYRKRFARLCARLGAIGIAGLDFIDYKDKVENKGIIVAPKISKTKNIVKNSSYFKEFIFGKKLFAKPEREMFQVLNRKAYSNKIIYIIDAAELGRIGIAICADIFDIKRWEIYRGRIHHFFIIAYNKDVKTFINFAHTISRTVFCNVVICNAGEFGSTIVVSPYKDDYKRVIFNEIGQNITNYQCIKLPINILDKAQKNDESTTEFKTLPPGYQQRGINQPNPQLFNIK